MTSLLWIGWRRTLRDALVFLCTILVVYSVAYSAHAMVERELHADGAAHETVGAASLDHPPKGAARAFAGW